MKIEFDGLKNAFDFGGLRTLDGEVISNGVFLRSDNIDKLSEKGWRELYDYGVRTIIDLRNENEKKNSNIETRPNDFSTIEIPLDANFSDKEFWKKWMDGPSLCTPIYYQSHLNRFPHVSSAIFKEIVNSKSGGVLFHCMAGRDRTGLISALLLKSLNVSDDVIIENHSACYKGLSDEEKKSIEHFLGSLNTDNYKLIKKFLSEIDVTNILNPEELLKLRIKAISCSNL